MFTAKKQSCTDIPVATPDNSQNNKDVLYTRSASQNYTGYSRTFLDSSIHVKYTNTPFIPNGFGNEPVLQHAGPYRKLHQGFCGQTCFLHRPQYDIGMSQALAVCLYMNQSK